PPRSPKRTGRPSVARASTHARWAKAATHRRRARRCRRPRAAPGAPLPAAVAAATRPCRAAAPPTSGTVSCRACSVDRGVIGRLLRRLRPRAEAIDTRIWEAACAAVPWAAALDQARRARLHGLATRFLREKTITPLDGLELNEVQRVQLAALCCLPLLESGPAGLRGWSQLLVYPEAFRVRRSHVDAAGVLHEWDDELAGEAWEQGPLVLSWADVQADLAEPDTGYCVAVHEMAHKLDVLDGVLDGT